MTTRPDPTEIVLARTYPASPDVVFAAWTNPQHLARWWGTPDVPGTAADIDLRVGGAWRACMTSADGTEHWSGGTFTTVDPPHALAFTFAWETYPDSVSTIELAFRPVDSGTEMVFHQRLQVSPATRDGYREGWEESFDRLAADLDRIVAAITA